MALFADEPDEPLLFQDEGDEADSDGEIALFRDEPDEVEALHVGRSSGSAPSALSSAPSTLLGDEPDEQSDDDDDDSDYLADNEGCSRRDQRLVALSFSTMNTFLATQIAKEPVAAPPPAKKRRCYNNSKRAAKAAATKELRERDKQLPTRLPRNDRAARRNCLLLVGCAFVLYGLVRCGYWILSEGRVASFIQSACKCKDGNCWRQFGSQSDREGLQEFLNHLDAPTVYFGHRFS